MPLQKGASCSVSEVSFRLRLEDCSAEEMEERQPLSVVAPSNSATHDVERTQRVEFVGMSNVPDGSAQDGMEWRRTLSQEQSSSAVGRLHRNGPVASTRALLQPRRSLLGKPLNYRAHRRDARLRRLQAKTYNFLERPKDWKSISYHLLVFLMVFMCLVLSVFSTIEQYEEIAGTILYYLELFVVVWFVGEFVIRIWSAGCRSRYQRLTGRLEFMRRPVCIVDMVVVCASVVILCLGSDDGRMFATSALRGLRFFQILRMVRVDRRGGSWKLLGSVIWAHRQELFTTLYIGFLGLIFASFLMYLAEKEKNPKKFGTYADALWWGVITLCTVGYGDTVPITWHGKLIAAFCAILGISFFALPAGILGSGFALKVQQQQRQKHLIRRKGPAAVLIQSLWRCYAADENSLSVATWKPHLRPCKTNQPQKFKHNASFMSRLSTRRKEGLHQSTANAVTSGLPSPMVLKRTILRRSCSPNRQMSAPSADDRGDIDSVESDRSRLSLNDMSGSRLGLLSISRNSDTKDSEDDLDETEGVTQLMEVHKRVIRSLRKIKFFVARRKFKEAFRPYDVKDVIEQYSAGNLDMLSRIKSLQSRLDTILGKTGSKKADVYESKISLASRIVKVERQIDDIESKLDSLIDLYKKDRQLPVEGGAKSDAHAHNGRSDSVDHVRHGFYSRPLRLRPAVTGKQHSEPSTPIVKNPVKPMLRNLSDLGPRIKKRVTIGISGCSSEVLYEQPQLYPIDGSQVESSSFDEVDDEVGSAEGLKGKFSRVVEEERAFEPSRSSSGSSLCPASETSRECPSLEAVANQSSGDVLSGEVPKKGLRFKNMGRTRGYHRDSEGAAVLNCGSRR